MTANGVTPTTEEVRQAYAVAHETTGASMDEREFDRWLADHNRKIAAEALREAAEAALGLGSVSGSHVAVGDRAATFLDARADRIEQGGQE